MPDDLPAQPQGLRLRNRRAILASIRRLRHAARVDVARDTGISAATVTSITAELAAEGLIAEALDAAPEAEEAAGERASARGRPRVLLRIRPEAYLVGGAKVSEDRITVTLMDFEGGELAHHAAPMPRRGETAAGVVGRLRAAVVEALALLGRDLGALDALGVGLPGFLDASRGLAYWSPCFRERDVGFGALLDAAFACPVFLDNDANLAALAEQRFGYGKGVPEFLVVTIEHGVGMGVVMDHRIYRGARGTGTEFGHTKVQLDGALCRCGQRGCLEAYVADYALLREAETAFYLGAGPPERQAGLDALFAAAKAGDATALSIFRRAGRMFSLALANLVNLFDPALIIFSGEQMRYDFLYGPQVLDQMRENALRLDRPPPEVRVHKWGDRLWAMGAGALAIDGLTERIHGEAR